MAHPIHGVPLPESVVHWPASKMHAIQVSKIGDQKTQEKGFPDFAIGGCSKDQGFIQRKDEIQVGELVQDDAFGCGDTKYRDGG